MSSKRTSNKTDFQSTNNRFGASSMHSGDYNPVM